MEEVSLADDVKGKAPQDHAGLDLDFANLRVTITKNGTPKTILADVTGSFHHGRVRPAHRHALP